MIITIDGSAGTGKTTVAKQVAQKLDFAYFDTGAMYRSLSWFLLNRKVDIGDEKQIEKALSDFDYVIKEEEGHKKYFVGARDVSLEIRSKQVTEVVSQISAYRSVRKALSETQKDYGAKGNAVFEGRDLGTVVFPHAEVKIFLTARPEVRARRRSQELKQKYPNEHVDEEEVLLSILKRDEYDSKREVAPLCCPEDAFIVDTSDLSIDEVVSKILDYIKNIHNL